MENCNSLDLLVAPAIGSAPKLHLRTWVRYAGRVCAQGDGRTGFDALAMIEPLSPRKIKACTGLFCTHVLRWHNNRHDLADIRENMAIRRHSRGSRKMPWRMSNSNF